MLSTDEFLHTHLPWSISKGLFPTETIFTSKRLCFISQPDVRDNYEAPMSHFTNFEFWQSCPAIPPGDRDHCLRIPTTDELERKAHSQIQMGERNGVGRLRFVSRDGTSRQIQQSLFRASAMVTHHHHAIK